MANAGYEGRRRIRYPEFAKDIESFCFLQLSSAIESDEKDAQRDLKWGLTQVFAWTPVFRAVTFFLVRQFLHKRGQSAVRNRAQEQVFVLDR